MDKLLKLLNSMPTNEQIEFANKCGTSIKYLRKCISTGQLLGSKICVAIEQNSKGKVTRKMLRPKDYVSHWPELATKKAA